MMKTDEINKEQPDNIEHMSPTAENKEAQQAAAAERQATFWEALKSNRKAALWSAAISLTIIMEGYDVGEYP